MDIFLLEDACWIATAPINVPAYDFDFGRFFTIRRPWEWATLRSTIGRFGAAPNYEGLFDELLADGVELVHSPEMHLRCSELPIWYPTIHDLTPRSAWFSEPPSVQEVEDTFGWPVFIKGSRQTSRHQTALAIAESRESYTKVVERIHHDPILHWQKFVVREFLSLRPVGGGMEGKIPPAFEFRTFWWKGECVGAGRYHTQAENYDWNSQEKRDALRLAQLAAERLDVTFLVIDLAQCKDGSWVIIELNDGQESGYAGIPPTKLWQQIVAHEKKKVSEE